ncbi:hypothetical protein JQ628_17415 [Bradyrhizobium lablabi]|uniref:COG4223 family protein n=1 Tax=Bradyrhizobium lablabi TaxID=722472 RepID=UPI001BA9FE00|nr:hypothetical protein [Bradyrhizobium lablabi]MBR1123308.1 hypothetical protein [Bradyrhizobium lablabi]
MVDDRPEEKGPLGDSGRPKREPPTIDLKATEVSETPKEPAEEIAKETAEQTVTAEADPQPAQAESEASPEPASPEISEPIEKPVSRPASPWLVAPISGAVAAALVVAVGWALGWPAAQAPQPAPQLNAAALDDLTGRIAGLETKLGKPAADPAAAARIEGIEKSLAGLRGELAATRAQADKLASAVNEVKAAPREAAAAPTVDLSEVNARIATIEREVAQQSGRIAEVRAAEAKAADAKPADDLPLRRLVAASLLDVLVRVGDPFAAALATTKSLDPNAAALKPLEGFATTGVPNANALCRELVTIVPNLNPPAADNAATTGTGIVDRLQAGASKLVRIQRADATGDDRGSVVARVTAAALRNDLAEARRQLNTLSPADRAPAQAWLDKADARDAALAASRKFASDAMAALAQARQ